MVSLDGIVEMLGANAHIIKHIFLLNMCKCFHAMQLCQWRWKNISKNLQEGRTWVLIMCSSCNAY
jgi:hypothetical protein